jgi:hypothetical protein
VTLEPNAVVGTPHGLSDLKVGQLVVAGGDASGQTLNAAFVIVAVDSVAGSASTASVSPAAVEPAAAAQTRGRSGRAPPAASS